MTARSPSALLLSASLHGLVVALILLLTYAMQTQVKEVPKVFELVAGGGDNYGATEAPLLGVPGGVKIAIPEPPTPPAPAAKVEAAAPVPVAAPEPVPVITKAPVQKAAKTTPTKTADASIPDLAKSVKRIERKRQIKQEAKDRAAREAEEKRISKAQFDAQNKAARTANSSSKVKHIDTDGIASGVVGGSSANKTGGAGGKALSREEMDLQDAYFAIVKQRLRDGLEKPPGLGDAVYAEAEFRLNADGSISGARITRPSGSNEFDRAVLDDIHHFNRVNPPSSWKGDTVSLTFRMKEDDGG
jgi:colicin import membrane protein